MIRLLLASLFALVVLPACAQEPAILTVKVENVSQRGGDIRVALYTRQTWSLDNADPVIDGVVPAVTGETIVRMKPVKPGEYGVKVFQDYNRNTEFDMNWLGMPIEKFGFSNDAHPILSEPGFDRTTIELRPGENTITIHLQ